MLFNVAVWVTHDEYNYDTDDDWRFGPDDDFVPAEFNSIERCVEQHDGITWSAVCDIRDSWAFTPGEIDFTVRPI